MLQAIHAEVGAALLICTMNVFVQSVRQVRPSC